VQEGDTIEGLAGRYGISSTSVLWNNLDLENADTLAVGQFLRVPMSDGIIYEIRMGDTLSDIAARFSVDIPAIVNFSSNHLANADGIAENQIIFVPNGTMPPPPAPAATPEPTSPPVRENPAPAPSEPAAPSSSGFIWPVYGNVSSYFSSSHPLGIDIDQFRSPGAPIHAAASGLITFAGGQSCCSYGLYVVINHQNGFETLYAHMASFAVSQGEYVNQGDVIGYVGLTGRTTGYHLHFEVHLNGAVVNPLNYLP
jgi:murein DD-endopeptidase MepM/ murein hydrolase activator NlpD